MLVGPRHIDANGRLLESTVFSCVERHSAGVAG